MKIQWNKVTWYSKLIAVIVFVATFVIAFYLGREYESLKTAEMIQAVVDHTQSQAIFLKHPPVLPAKSAPAE